MGKKTLTENSWRNDPQFKALVSAFLSLKTTVDIENFLRDIATLSELKAMGERLEVAKLLAQGLTYREVAKRTGASTTTVTRVAHFIESGEGGYRKYLKKDAKEFVEDLEEMTERRKVKSQGVKKVSALQKYL